ncbi:unnamed protein product [Allacma fusca]|uniref:Uncharacterized protein n=1 Tax=Allacma fusca TaxID=39272 RepID=A0A8J2KZK7_9HEXA|nr:unnamed protein product [Allacma fusca]
MPQLVNLKIQRQAICTHKDIIATRAKDVEECNFCMMQFGAGNGKKLKTHVAYLCPKLLFRNRIDERTDVNVLARFLITQHTKRVALKELVKAGMQNKSLNRAILFMLHWHRWESSALWRQCNERTAFQGIKGKRNAGNHAGLLVADIMYSAGDTIVTS